MTIIHDPKLCNLRRCTVNIIIDWILATWLYISAGIAGATAFYFFSKRQSLSIPSKICSIFLVFLVLHMIEEYVYPSGFFYAFNMVLGSADPMAYPLNSFSCMVTNFVGVLFFAFVLWKWSEKVWATLTIAIFGIAQLVVHLIFGFASLEMFGEAGQILPYSPGLFTSVILFLPLSIYCFVYIAKSKSLSIKHAGASIKEISIAVLVVIIIIAGLIMVPMQTFGNDPDTSYRFISNGYYEKYS